MYLLRCELSPSRTIFAHVWYIVWFESFFKRFLSFAFNITVYRKINDLIIIILYSYCCAFVYETTVYSKRMWWFDFTSAVTRWFRRRSSLTLMTVGIYSLTVRIMMYNIHEKSVSKINFTCFQNEIFPNISAAALLCFNLVNLLLGLNF